MCKTEFIPKIFETETVEYHEGTTNQDWGKCIPGYPNIPHKINTLLLSCPEQVIYHIDNIDELPTTHKFFLPICVYDDTTNNRSLKYYYLEDTIHIRRIGEDKWYKGLVYSIYPNAAPHPDRAKMERLVKKERKKAQKYSEAELNDGQSGATAINFNLFDFLIFPVTSGRYEIYYSAIGLESNHCFVDIIIKEDCKKGIL